MSSPCDVRDRWIGIGGRAVDKGVSPAGEAWRAVPGYEGCYEVSNLGNVRSVTRWSNGRLLNGKPMSPVLDSHGYATVRFYKEGVGTRHKLHRIVCRAFHGEPAEGQQAAHLDGDRSNARSDNLTWASQSENESHKKAHGTANTGQRHGMARLTQEAVENVRTRAAAGENLSALAREFGISTGHCSDIAKGKKWKA